MRESGWKLIEAISDFGRMGIPNRYWTITDANRNYEVILSLLFAFWCIQLKWENIRKQDFEKREK